MIVRNLTRAGWTALLVCGLGVASAGTAWGQAAAPNEPVRMAERSTTLPLSRATLVQTDPNEHPLMPALRWAQAGIKDIEKVQDYSATVVKRERVDGKIGEREYMFVKVRHKPFSVYLQFLKPDSVKGQEVIYVDGANNGKLLGHGTGIKKLAGTVPLDPHGLIAMRGNRYPITELGVLNLTRRLLEVGEKDAQYGECEVKFIPNAKINDRVCTCIQVFHPVPRRNFLFHIARIFVDDELNIPIRYEAYDWPAQQGGAPELIEEYTYLGLKLNNGYTDADFDVNNTNYEFPRKS